MSQQVLKIIKIISYGPNGTLVGFEPTLLFEKLIFRNVGENLEKFEIYHKLIPFLTGGFEKEKKSSQYTQKQLTVPGI